MTPADKASLIMIQDSLKEIKKELPYVSSAAIELESIEQSLEQFLLDQSKEKRNITEYVNIEIRQKLLAIYNTEKEKKYNDKIYAELFRILIALTTYWSLTTNVSKEPEVKYVPECCIDLEPIEEKEDYGMLVSGHIISKANLLSSWETMQYFKNPITLLEVSEREKNYLLPPEKIVKIIDESKRNEIRNTIMPKWYSVLKLNNPKSVEDTRKLIAIITGMALFIIFITTPLASLPALAIIAITAVIGLTAYCFSYYMLNKATKNMERKVDVAYEEWLKENPDVNDPARKAKIEKEKVNNFLAGINDQRENILSNEEKQITPSSSFVSSHKQSFDSLSQTMAVPSQDPVEEKNSVEQEETQPLLSTRELRLNWLNNAAGLKPKPSEQEAQISNKLNLGKRIFSL